MTFPTAGSVVYRNEDGEVLGWDSPSYGESIPEDWDTPEWDDYYAGHEHDGEADPATCEHGDTEQCDRRTGSIALEEMPTPDALYWECLDCGTEFPICGATDGDGSLCDSKAGHDGPHEDY